MITQEKNSGDVLVTMTVEQEDVDGLKPDSMDKYETLAQFIQVVDHSHSNQ
jgi:hypothetical protein